MEFVIDHLDEWNRASQLARTQLFQFPSEGKTSWITVFFLKHVSEHSKNSRVVHTLIVGVDY